jgi:hypothetical protein
MKCPYCERTRKKRRAYYEKNRERIKERCRLQYYKTKIAIEQQTRVKTGKDE